MKKASNTILVIMAIIVVGFTGTKPQISYTMPCIVTSVDTFPEGLNVHLREAGNWKPLQSFSKRANDTLWVYRIAK